MYVYATTHAEETEDDVKKVFPIEPKDGDHENETWEEYKEREKLYEEIFYWRKHPDLHGWFGALYLTKGGKLRSDEMASGTGNFQGPVRIRLEDLAQLEKVVREENLPKTTGFFFGVSHKEYKSKDLKFIEIARERLLKGEKLYYDSSW